MTPAEFARRVLAWFDQYGRKDLPWQQAPTPYRVWVSEIMLQQTQVVTVIPYYQRFMDRFPDVVALAEAPQDEVLHHWSGLGYYARARNLQKAAGVICHQYAGQFPVSIDELTALPGIGRSTAGAILALSSGQRQPILDGNVKRVLARFAAIEGWPGHGRVSSRLWDLAEYYTPQAHVAEYTQAMMDLGATVCTRSRPLCDACPLADGCAAKLQNQQSAYPTPKPRKELPEKATTMLLLQAKTGEVLLEKRPPSGIWGGLWGFPECAIDTEIDTWCQTHFQIQPANVQKWSVIKHGFTHFRLKILPIHVQIESKPDLIMEADRFVWYNVNHPDERGLAAPVKRLLEALATDLINS